MSPLQRISNWFNSHCDGEFEHLNGVTLETMDNPAWSLKIDLPVSVPEMDVTTDDFQWGVSQGEIIGYADMDTLDALLQSVAAFVETLTPNPTRQA